MTRFTPSSQRSTRPSTLRSTARPTRRAFVPWLCLAGALAAGPLAGCQSKARLDASERQAIADTLQQMVEQAYDFSRPDAASRLLSLYADSGRVISAAAGRVTTTRAALATDIAGFWERVGQNMRGPKFEFGSRYVDIITRDAALMTFTYRIPHRTPMDTPHTVSGAWTTFWRRENGRWRIVQEHLSDTPESTAPGPTPPDSAQIGMDSMSGMVMPDMPRPGSASTKAQPSGTRHAH